MRVGTKSVLFGAHAFWLHPFALAVAWWKLYRWTPALDGGRWWTAAGAYRREASRVEGFVYLPYVQWRKYSEIQDKDATYWAETPGPLPTFESTKPEESDGYE